MVQPKFNAVLHVNPYRSQVFISVGNDNRLIFLEGGQELLLMVRKIALTSSPLK